MGCTPRKMNVVIPEHHSPIKCKTNKTKIEIEKCENEYSNVKLEQERLAAQATELKKIKGSCERMRGLAQYEMLLEEAKKIIELDAEDIEAL